MKEEEKPKKRYRTKRSGESFKKVSLLLGILFISFIAGMLGAGLIFKTNIKEPSIATTSAVDGNEFTTGNEISVSKVAEAVGPSVVSIITESQLQTMYGSVMQAGAGTGVIVSSDGYVMTNKHVVGNAKVVDVMLDSGKLYEEVKVVGSDPLNDIAFLKIDQVSDLPVVTLGDSHTVRVGQQVIAIGNALGQYQNTVTTGILSGVGRPVTAGDSSGQNQENLVDLLQTDAAINSGNSGGPLVNLAGQVIGINTAIAADANNIGFAIPINATKGILSEVLKTGKVERAFLGVNFVNITPAVAKQYNLSVNSGALVLGDQAVAADSPAAAAGIQSGDIILSVGGNEVGPTQGLSTIIGMYRPGAKVDITILRAGKETSRSVVLGAYAS